MICWRIYQKNCHRRWLSWWFYSSSAAYVPGCSGGAVVGLRMSLVQRTSRVCNFQSATNSFLYTNKLNYVRLVFSIILGRIKVLSKLLLFNLMLLDFHIFLFQNLMFLGIIFLAFINLICLSKATI